MRDKLGIDSTLSNYEAQKEMQNTYSTYPPISITNMQYTYDNEKTTFLEGYDLKTNLSAREAFAAIRKKMEIRSTVSDAQGA